jgi:hypothetical protein
MIKKQVKIVLVKISKYFMSIRRVEFLLFLLQFWVLGVEPSALHMLGKHSSYSLSLNAYFRLLFWYFDFDTESHYLFGGAGFKLVILLSLLTKYLVLHACLNKIEFSKPNQTWNYLFFLKTV